MKLLVGLGPTTARLSERNRQKQAGFGIAFIPGHDELQLVDGSVWIAGEPSRAAQQQAGGLLRLISLDGQLQLPAEYLKSESLDWGACGQIAVSRLANVYRTFPAICPQLGAGLPLTTWVQMTDVVELAVLAECDRRTLGIYTARGSE
ncbi:MAG: hypothetical protein ACK5Q5_15010 [Planctomycetaceae bacterium]